MRFTSLLIATLLLAGCGRQEASDPAPAAPPVQFQRLSTNPVEHGQRLSSVLGCAGCHGADLTGEDWSEPGFGRLWTANLTRAVPAYSDAQLAAAIRGGVRHDGTELWEMPSHLFTALTAEDMTALIAFLRSRPPAGEARPLPSFEAGAHREIAQGTFKSSRTQVAEEGGRWPPDAGPRHALGRYIVRATCAECHGMNLAGGQPHPKATPRPDLRAIVPAYDAAAFERLMRTGKALEDRELRMMSDVARGRYRHFSAGELEAVRQYLLAVGGG
ncbi:MAG TPA: cytochrome c [Allosphingosinicella sp.]|jgi:cytochrome c553